MVLGRRSWRAMDEGDANVGDRGHVVALQDDIEAHHEVTPMLTGDDVDADWRRAESSGEEAVGGGEPTADQDVVDELARALGAPRWRERGRVADARARWANGDVYGEDPRCAWVPPAAA